VNPGGATVMSDFGILEAESMAAALAIAKRCPCLDIDR